MEQTTSLFDGHQDQEAAAKDVRLASQLVRVYKLMSNGTGWTLEDLSLAVNAPTSSVSARIRDLRKPRFGAHIIDRIHEGHGLYTYWMMGETNPLLDGKGSRSAKADARIAVREILDRHPKDHSVYVQSAHLESLLK